MLVVYRIGFLTLLGDTVPRGCTTGRCDLDIHWLQVRDAWTVREANRYIATNFGAQHKKIRKESTRNPNRSISQWELEIVLQHSFRHGRLLGNGIHEYSTGQHPFDRRSWHSMLLSSGTTLWGRHADSMSLPHRSTSQSFGCWKLQRWGLGHTLISQL